MLKNLDNNKTPYEKMFDTSDRWTWEDAIDWYENQLNYLVIEDDMDHNKMRHLDKMIDDLYRIYRKDHARISERAGKIDRYIKRIVSKAAASVTGRSNDKARKAAGIQAAESAIIDKGKPPVNLYDLEDEYIAYNEYMKYIGDVLSNKTGALIRVLGASKIDGWLAR